MKHQLLACALVLATSACVTKKQDLGDDYLSLSAGGQQPRAASGDPVVIQTGRSDIIASTKSRDRWVETAKSSKNSVAKLESALALGEGVAAENLARKLLIKQPGDPQLLGYLAAALAQQQKYQLAGYYAKVAEKKRPGDPNLLNIRALSIMMQANGRLEDLHRAEALLQQATSYGSDQIAAPLNLGRLYMAMGKSDDAAVAFQQAANRCKCLAAYIGEGTARLNLKQFDKALAAFEKAEAKAPRNPVVLYHLALVHRSGYNDKDRAKDALEKLLASSDDAPAQIREKAQTLLRNLEGEAHIQERMAKDDSVEGNNELELMKASLEDDEAEEKVDRQAY